MIIAGIACKIGVIVLLFVAVFINVDAQQMSDEKRARYGLGPKGQGRK